jgi:lipopolysaccharide/colanic/teichoic acid biosynthesis glycosyltransferase
MSTIDKVKPLWESESKQSPGQVSDINSIDLRAEMKHRWYLPVKATVDFGLALVLLVLTLPVTLLGAFLVKITSPGPAFYLQKRLGKDGRSYHIIKLRTMVQDAEVKSGPVWSQAGDPRVTKIGRILRKTHVDEFPQLLNVLMGQMSLVGPRPERPEIASTLEWEVERYSDRTIVRPGITGLAQLRLPPDSDLEGVRKKVACDLYYVKNASPWLDLRLIVFTGWLFAKVFLVAAWKRIYIPAPETIEANINELFREKVDLDVRSDSAKP